VNFVKRMKIISIHGWPSADLQALILVSRGSGVGDLTNERRAKGIGFLQICSFHALYAITGVLLTCGKISLIQQAAAIHANSVNFLLT